MARALNSRGFRALLATQFLGAFNDNAFKLVVSLLAVNLFVRHSGGTEYLSLPTAVFIIPFLLFSTYAGFFADKIGKHRIIIAAKAMELAIMVLAFFALESRSINALLCVLFFMGMQSAFFGPAKYGILPEMLDEADLSEGNGALQMWTYLAIIFGTAFGGFVFYAAKNTPAYAALALIAISVAGLLSASFVGRVPAAGSRRRFEWNVFAEIGGNVRRLSTDAPLLTAIAGLVYFSLLASVFQLNILLYARKIMQANEFLTGCLLTVLALGVGSGSMIAGRASAKKVEFGFVPLGALGLSLFSILLGFTYASLPLTGLCLFILGISAGFYIVPLNTYIQQKSPADQRGQVLATLNFFSFLAILIGTVLIYAFREWLKWNAVQIFIVCGWLSISATAYIFKVLPIAFIRLLNWVLTHSIFKLKVTGIENVPLEGGALLVCNHVSFIDPLIILGSLPRHVRFLMWRRMCELPLVKPIAGIMRVIPVSFEDPPKAILNSLQEAREAVEKGELVCIFAEGHLTKSGNMQPFRRGFEHIMKELSAPIIPMYIDRIWGTLFGFEDGKYRWRMPKIIPCPITICYGKPLAAQARVHEVRTAVLELSAEAYKQRGPDRVKLHIAFIREVKQHPFRFCMADTTGIKLNYVQVLATVMLLSRKLFPPLASSPDKDEMVGVLLPASCMASMVNGAALFSGKIPVNLNFTASREGIFSSIEQCRMKRVITSRKFLEKLNIELPDTKLILLEDLKSKISAAEKIKALLAAFLFPAGVITALYVRGDRHNVDDTATVIFSSGSTGLPKGVMLTHENISSNIEGFYQIMRLDEHDVVLGILPFFHSFGFTATLCLPVGSGVAVVYHNNPLDAAMVGKLAEKYKATILLGTPTFFSAYIKKCTQEQFKSIRYALTGAEKLKENIARAFYEKFGIVPFEGYGATELSPIVSLGIPDCFDKNENILQKGYKPGKVGHPIPGVAAKIVNPDTFELLPYDTEGLLIIRGPNVMKGYLNQPEKTAEVIKDGWYITGDIAVMDEDGFIQITDRLSRFSKIAGEMVPHIKVEEEIIRILGTVEPVCAVTSVPDEKKGERLAVLYAQEIDIDALWEKLNNSGLPKLWIPKKASFYRVENIPFLGSGKMDLKQIKKIARERCEGEEA
ncbi:MAG: MFS transporter [Candidatus Omnitrophica bacterium]|nr:MFS transporter [Candidatus Omnitrophota bacterium]